MALTAQAPLLGPGSSSCREGGPTPLPSGAEMEPMILRAVRAERRCRSAQNLFADWPPHPWGFPTQSSPWPPPACPSFSPTFQLPHFSPAVLQPAWCPGHILAPATPFRPELLRLLAPPPHRTHTCPSSSVLGASVSPLQSGVHTHLDQAGPCWPLGREWGPRLSRTLTRLPPYRLPQAAPLPAAASSQREHRAGGGGRPPRGLHPIHRQRRRGCGLPAPPPPSGQPHQPIPHPRQVFFSR